MKSEFHQLGQYIDKLQSEGRYWFLRSDVKKALKMSDTALKFALYRLAQKDRVKRILSDFYVIVPLEYQSIGCLPAEWFIDALMQHQGCEYYVSLLSAAAIHGAAHQQPMSFQVMTNKILRDTRVGNLKIKFYYKKEIKSEFTQKVKTETGYMSVSTPEMTIVDLVRRMDAAGQIHNVATILHELCNTVEISNVMKIVQSKGVEIATIQRLGYLLEYLEVPLDLKSLQEVVKNKLPHYRPLVVGLDVKPYEKNKHWRILVNEKVEPDI